MFYAFRPYGSTRFAAPDVRLRIVGSDYQITSQTPADDPATTYENYTLIEERRRVYLCAFLF